MSKTSVVFIDYENVQSIDENIITTYSYINIIVGVDQTRIPIELVQKLQVHGKKVNWIQIHGKGKNALDFLIAYYLGLSIAKREYDEYCIYSKDKGYDPLIKHILETGISIKRIETLKSLVKPATTLLKNKKVQVIDKNNDSDYEKIIENIKNVGVDKRPKTHIKLHGHIKTVLNNKRNDEEIEEIIRKLIVNKIIIENKKKIEYKI